MNEYLKIVSQLPCPTEEQTRAFVDHVTNAHSWYKHLPVFPPGATFIFYLDPQAGRAVKECGGPKELAARFGEYKGITRPRIVIEDYTDPSQCWHYRMRLTSDYRRDFGYWNYCWASEMSWDNVRLQVYSVETVDLESELRPFQVPILVEVAEEIFRDCRCQLTALIRGYAKYRCSLDQLPVFLKDLERYAEGRPNRPSLDISRKLRRELEEAGVFELRPDAICDIEILSDRSRIRVWECLLTPPKGIELGRSVTHEFDASGFSKEAFTTQSSALFHALMRSREVFSKLCRRIPQP